MIFSMQRNKAGHSVRTNTVQKDINSTNTVVVVELTVNSLRQEKDFHNFHIPVTSLKPVSGFNVVVDMDQHEKV